MSERLAAAAAAYDVALAETGLPAAGVLAAALELDMPMADALNALVDAGELDWAFWGRSVKHPVQGWTIGGLVRACRVAVLDPATRLPVRLPR